VTTIHHEGTARRCLGPAGFVPCSPACGDCWWSQLALRCGCEAALAPGQLTSLDRRFLADVAWRVRPRPGAAHSRLRARLSAHVRAPLRGSRHVMGTPAAARRAGGRHPGAVGTSWARSRSHRHLAATLTDRSEDISWLVTILAPIVVAAACGAPALSSRGLDSPTRCAGPYLAPLRGREATSSPSIRAFSSPRRHDGGGDGVPSRLQRRFGRVTRRSTPAQPSPTEAGSASSRTWTRCTCVDHHAGRRRSDMADVGNRGPEEHEVARLGSRATAAPVRRRIGLRHRAARHRRSGSAWTRPSSHSRWPVRPHVGMPSAPARRARGGRRLVEPGAASSAPPAPRRRRPVLVARNE